MNKHIQFLLSQILLLVARLHAEERYQVFCRTSGHVQQIDVRLYPLDSQWYSSEETTKPLAEAAVYFGYKDRSWRDEQEWNDQAARELEFLRAALTAYTKSDIEPIKEAA